MSYDLARDRKLPESQHDLNTYWGRVRHTASIIDPRSLLIGSEELQNARQVIAAYRRGEVREMSTELWQAKKITDSILHPDTGQPVLLPFRMSCYVLSGLPITALMLTPGLGMFGTITGQVLNQSLNVAVNYANANESSRLSDSRLAQSYLLTVAASCSVAVGLTSAVPRLRSLSAKTKILLGRLVPFAAVASAGALNVFLVRSEELREGIDIYPTASNTDSQSNEASKSLGRSKKAALLAVSETAFSRVLNCAPIMVLPPLILLRLQRTQWLRRNPRMLLPVNFGLITVTSFAALPLALGAFPQRQSIHAKYLESEFHNRGGSDGMVVFNRGI